MDKYCMNGKPSSKARPLLDELHHLSEEKKALLDDLCQKHHPRLSQIRQFMLAIFGLFAKEPGATRQTAETKRQALFSGYGEDEDFKTIMEKYLCDEKFQKRWSSSIMRI